MRFDFGETNFPVAPQKNRTKVPDMLTGIDIPGYVNRQLRGALLSPENPPLPKGYLGVANQYGPSVPFKSPLTNSAPQTHPEAPNGALPTQINHPIPVQQIGHPIGIQGPQAPAAKPVGVMGPPKPTAQPTSAPAAPAPAPQAPVPPKDPYREYLQRAIQSPGASWEGHNHQVPVYRGPGIGGPPVEQIAQQRQIGFQKQLEDYDRSNAIGVQAQAEMAKAQAADPRTAINAILGLNPNDIAKLSLSHERNAVNAMAAAGALNQKNPNGAIGPANYESHLQAYPWIGNILSDKNLGLSSRLGLLRRQIGENRNSPEWQLVNAYLARALGAPETRQELLAPTHGESPSSRGEGFFGPYLTEWQSGYQQRLAQKRAEMNALLNFFGASQHVYRPQ